MNPYHSIHWTIFLAALLAVSCTSTPTIPAPEAAADIAGKIAEGDLRSADRRFDAILNSERHRSVAFSVLYAQSQHCYEQQDYETAIRYLRFLTRHYSRAGAPKEALLFALFLERAQRRSTSDEETASEMHGLLTELSQRDAEAPVWLDLIAAQVSIDRERYASARASLRLFQARWNESPPEIKPYVTELERFLSTHREDPK